MGQNGGGQAIPRSKTRSRLSVFANPKKKLKSDFPASARFSNDGWVFAPFFPRSLKRADGCLEPGLGRRPGAGRGAGVHLWCTQVLRSRWHRHAATCGHDKQVQDIWTGSTGQKACRAGLVLLGRPRCEAHGGAVQASLPPDLVVVQQATRQGVRRPGRCRPQTSIKRSGAKHRAQPRACGPGRQRSRRRWKSSTRARRPGDPPTQQTECTSQRREGERNFVRRRACAVAGAAY